MKYLLAKPNVPAAYLGFGARIVDVKYGSAVVEVPAEHARWQLGRLQSGLETRSRKILEGHEVEAEAKHWEGI